MSTTSNLTQDPGYFTRYKNFALGRSASGVLTLRFHTDGGPHTFDGTTHHDFPRLLEDIAFDTDNRVLVLTGTGDSFISDIDGPSLGDLTKPMAADVLYTEGRRGLQRLADLEIPIIAAVNGPATVHSEYALLADVVIASDTAVFADVPHLAFAIAPGDGLFVVWEEVLGLNRARYLEITQGSFTAQEALSWGAVAKVVPLDQVLPQARELAEQMTRRPHLTNKYIAVVFRQRISRRLRRGHADRDGPGKPDRRQPRLPPAGVGRQAPEGSRQLPGKQAAGQALTGMHPGGRLRRLPHTRSAPAWHPGRSAAAWPDQAKPQPAMRARATAKR